MTQRPRRLALVVLLPVLAFVIAACAIDSTPSASPTPDASPAFTEAPGTSQPLPTEGPTTQTDTDWGRIWDGVPTGFPVYPGAGPTTPTSPDPASATWAIEGGDPLEIASWMQTSLETATYSTEAMSGPFEDGGFVIDSVGVGECRIETRIVPQGGLAFVSVRYGAACPID